MNSPQQIIIILFVNRVEKIEDFNYPKLKEVEQVASRLSHFSIQLHHFEVYGICKECQELSK